MVKPEPEHAAEHADGHDLGRVRCPWCGTDPLYVAYHDLEWGVPLRDDRLLFELLLLEGAQAGLSWLTVLRRRQGYREAYGDGTPGLDPQAVARFTEADRARLLADARIIRNRAKVAASLGNARAYLKVQEEFGSFSGYLWRFVDGTPIRNAWTELRQVPPRTPLSDAISKDLLSRGFTFVGSTIVYAYLQSAGLVNDHLTGCFRHAEL